MPPPMTPPANSTDPDMEPKPAVIRQAAEWMAHIDAGDITSADIEALRLWQEEHPSHRIALERMGSLGKDIQAKPLQRTSLQQLFLRRRQSVGFTGLALVLLGAGALLTRVPFQTALADERTAAGEMRSVKLVDGSSLVLASDTQVDLDVGAENRSVHLLRGEVLAKVITGQSRRFRVETSDGWAEALGTEFTVRRDGNATLVSVASSKVRACAKGAMQDACITLSPGERARIADGKVQRLAEIMPQDVTAWTDGWLTASETPLPEVLDSLNRWREHPIRFDRRALANRKVSGVFPLADTDRALANLAQSQSLSIDRSNPRSPVVQASAK